MPAMEAAVLASRVMAIEEIGQLAWRIKMVVLLNALIAAGYALFVAVAILLVRTYRRTHAIGFIWLGVAVLVWPLAARPLRFLVDRVGPGPFDTIGQFAA